MRLCVGGMSIRGDLKKSGVETIIMCFNTKEDYTKHLNEMYVDHWKQIDPSRYTKSDKFYLYPDYTTFDKEYSETLDTGKYVNELMNSLVVEAIFAQNEKKPVELLTSNEKMGIYLGAGIPMRYENGKFTTTYNVGISLIDDKYKVFYNIDPFNETYY